MTNRTTIAESRHSDHEHRWTHAKRLEKTIGELCCDKRSSVKNAPHCVGSNLREHYLNLGKIKIGVSFLEIFSWNLFKKYFYIF